MKVEWIWVCDLFAAKCNIERSQYETIYEVTVLYTLFRNLILSTNNKIIPLLYLIVLFFSVCRLLRFLQPLLAPSLPLSGLLLSSWATKNVKSGTSSKRLMCCESKGGAIFSGTVAATMIVAEEEGTMARLQTWRRHSGRYSAPWWRDCSRWAASYAPWPHLYGTSS